MALPASPERSAGKVVLVTGSGQGIGAAIAAEFARRGYRVAGADRAYAGVEAGSDLLRIACDVGDRASVEMMIGTVQEALGPIEILVNNAGIYPMQPFETISPEDWSRVMATNLTSVFNTCQCALPAMRQAGWGRVINIVSNTFFMGLPNFAHYIASKGAVIGMTRSIAAEYGRFGITANCIAPNFTRTEGTAVVEAQAPEVVAQTVASQAIPRVALPQDVLDAVLFLAGEGAGFMTGQTLVCDGGTIKH
ncbi:hypothetical protein NSE01_34600 [Novosphingobium sediminis]|uniref:Ketoreductase domain-containing protein n=1 Tax=Novosphingobium sediminis TaxID=707214 RepID=A0A512APJ1_9SPHN|nr:SDR family NAD(P)-dependent oxidoreductase [Novosphingobium sediminis]GEO01628.1 hypothetical protein NSE01_34600 [Novosphingobium sediminis]